MSDCNHHTLQNIGNKECGDDIKLTDNECNVSYHPSTLKAKLQSNVFKNKFPKNDVNVFTNKNTVPGNSETSSVIKDGKSLRILSDSICKRFKINELNK